MAKRAIRKTFSFKKLSRKLNPIVIANLNIIGNRINKAKQDGIDSGEGIEGKFERLSPATKALGGRKPLLRSGTMRETKKTPATLSNPSFLIEMVGKDSRTGKVYGAYHNTGYTNSEDAWFPGAKVPRRLWFGIPKSMREGGAELKKTFLQISMNIKMAWKAF